MLKIISLVIALTFALARPLPEPEIVAEPVPLLDQSAIHPYLGPVSSRSSGHRGVDLENMKGKNISSPFDGRVSFVGKVFDRNVITIQSATGLKASFEPVCSELAKWDNVSAGQPIGQYCPGEEGYDEHCESCVHFSIRTSRGYLNPLLFYGLIQPSKIVA